MILLLLRLEVYAGRKEDRDGIDTTHAGLTSLAKHQESKRRFEGESRKLDAGCLEPDPFLYDRRRYPAQCRPKPQLLWKKSTPYSDGSAPMRHRELKTF